MPVTLTRSFIPAFSPLNDITSGTLQAWYDFSDASTLFTDIAGTSPVSSDGDTLRRANDKSGHGRHLTEDTQPGDYRVAARNGNSILETTQNERIDIDSAGWAPEIDPPHAWFAALKLPAAQLADIVMDAEGSDFLHGIRWFNTVVIRVGGSFSTTLPADIWATVTVENRGLPGYPLYIWDGNVIEPGSGTGGGDFPIQSLRLGVANTGSESVSAIDEFGELLFYSGVMSDADRTAVQNYLINKWGTSAGGSPRP